MNNLELEQIAYEMDEALKLILDEIRAETMRRETAVYYTVVEYVEEAA